MLRILIEDSEGKSKLASINPDESDVTIGRQEGNFIRLRERNVSRKHARIFSTSEGLFIEPVAARYGLKLNSAKIEGKTPLALGDEIRIGDYRLYIQDENQPDPRQTQTDEVVDIEPNLQPRFVVISSNFAGVEYHVQRSKIVIGRDPASDIHINHQSVSSHHAEVRRNARGDYEIRDLNSSNGTKINGVPITEAFRLSSGDCITLGHVSMRFCAPGDFWSLNFGINDEPPKNNIPIYFLGTVLLIIAFLAVFAIYLSKDKNENNNQSPQVTTNAADDKAAKEAEFVENLFKCQDDMQKGNFGAAENACNKAGEIFPNDQRYLAKNSALQSELSSKKAFDRAQDSLFDDDCNSAMAEIENIKPGTYAYQLMREKKLTDKADECRQKHLYEGAIKAIENGDIDTAELNRDEIKKINSFSEYVDRLDDAIKKAKGASRAGSGDSGSGNAAPKAAKSNKGSSEPKAEAPAPKPSVDAADLCNQATMAKAKGKVCEAYSLYRKAKAAGYPNDTCKKHGDNYIASHAGECAK